MPKKRFPIGWNYVMLGSMISKRLFFPSILAMSLAAPAVLASDLAAGWTHSAAVQEGRVWTWGDNARGQLGQPDAGRALLPRPVAGVDNAAAVAAAWHTLALTSDGQVWAWGSNAFGQVGNGRFGRGEVERAPVRVAELEDVAAVAAGWDHSLALTRDGKVWAWGCRSHGQLGDGVRETGRPAASPQPVPGLKSVVAVAAGGQHSLALTADGRVWAWGSNWNGQLGNGRLGAGTHSAKPQPVAGADGNGTLMGIRAIAAGGLHSVAVAEDGTVWAWGYNGAGQVPIATRSSFWEGGGPRDVPASAAALAAGGKKALFTRGIAAAGGYEATYVLDASGAVHSAGWAMYGELGSGAFGGGNRDTLGPVATGKQVVWAAPKPGIWRPGLACLYTDPTHVAIGVEDLEVAEVFEGSPLVVGEAGASGSTVGRIARNADNVEIQALLTYPVRTAEGQPVALMLGQLMFGAHAGDDDFARQVRLRLTEETTGETVDLPLETGEQARAGVLPPLSGIVTVAGGMHHALARDRDGQVWAWGHNGFGQVGDGSVTDGAVAQRVDFDAKAAALPPEEDRRHAVEEESPPTGKMVLNVREHGAAGDGIELDHEALQRAIDACAAKGGGVVRFPAGTYLTGTLELRDGVRLHLDGGATILASTNRDHYSDRALILARGVRDIGIGGSGTIDGQGTFTGARDWRHHCILMEDCREVAVEGVSTINAGSWTQHYIRCIGLTLRGLTVRSLLPGRNNDGIDLTGCENARIEGCTVISDDDAIVIKSTRAERENRNIMVTGNICHTYRGAFKLGTETRGAYSNIVCRDLTCYGSKAIELYSVDGSESEGIVVENVRAHDALVALNIRLGARLRPSYWDKGTTPKVGHLRNIRIRNVEVDLAYRAWRDILLEHGIPDAEWATGRPESPYDSCISGLPEYPVEDVAIEGLKVRAPGGAAKVPDAATLPERPEAYPHAGNFGVLPAYGLFVRHAKGVTVRDATFEVARPDARPAVASFRVEGFEVE